MTRDVNHLVLLVKESVQRIANTPDDETEHDQLNLLIDDLVTKFSPTEARAPLASPPSYAPIIKFKPLKVIIEGTNEAMTRFQSQLRDLEKRARESDWIESLFPDPEEKGAIEFFRTIYWRHLKPVWQNKTLMLGSPLINPSALPESQYDGLYYDYEDQQWHIDPRFFFGIAERYQVDLRKKLKAADKQRVITAARMYIVHESFHADVQTLNPDTVDGIGRFPRVIEEADYQADVYAILTELYYQRIEGNISTGTNLKKAALDLIDVALDTTFSFINTPELRYMQIRRVQRVVLWCWQWVQISLIDSKEEKLVFEYICKILAEKPVIDIHGPKIKATDMRVYYELQISDPDKLTIGVYHKNKIIRSPKGSHLKHELIFEGLRSLNHKTIKDALRSLITERGLRSL